MKEHFGLSREDESLEWLLQKGRIAGWFRFDRVRQEWREQGWGEIMKKRLALKEASGE
jgi:hypothetical protein